MLSFKPTFSLSSFTFNDKTPDSSALPNNTNNKTENLSIAFKPLKVSLRDVNTNDKSNYYSFTTELFSKSHKNGENTLISPLSVYLALSMLTNGAEENTLAQLEEILGMSSDELNLFVKSYMSSLPNTTYSKMKIANSVWFRDAESFKVNDSFLQTNANYFSADIYKAPFNQSTVNDINSWVKEKTDGMIDKIVNEISETTVMYLINALSFEAEWENQYLEYDVGEGEFKTANGDVQTEPNTTASAFFVSMLSQTLLSIEEKPKPWKMLSPKISATESSPMNFSAIMKLSAIPLGTS